KSVVRLVGGKARFQRSELLLTLQQVGAQALPIVSLISFLVGIILAYVGALQLRQFGAQVYVADLVGVAMTREMGAMMAAIIMAGRTGAAFAAQLGTMQVNEEIDALSTLGIPAMDFLVLPRMLALALMMPLLGVYADLLGVLGGAIVGIGMLDLGSAEYYFRTIHAIGLDDFAAGIVKASVFGVLVAIAGCLRGMQCGRSSAAVGAAATSAVVTGIVFIIVSDALMTVIFEPARGDVFYDSASFWGAEPHERGQILRRIGVLYQSGALWSSMTLAENVSLPLQEYTGLRRAEIREVASLKLALVGLAGFEDFYPSEISGGMRKRAGLARAMALDPDILFFDEPSAGLDPISSRLLDDLILELRDSL